MGISTKYYGRLKNRYFCLTLYAFSERPNKAFWTVARIMHLIGGCSKGVLHATRQAVSYVLAFFWLDGFAISRPSTSIPYWTMALAVGRLETSTINGKSNCFTGYTQSILGGTKCKLTGERVLGNNLGQLSIC